MKTLPHLLACLSTAILLLALPPAHAATPQTLWTIGKADGDNADFALAPGNYRQFTHDAYYVVGRSTPRQDWPYVHPGPGDQWAGSRNHTFTIVFGLAGAIPGQPCQLAVDLLDTHNSSPPKLRVVINGKAFEHALPPGAGDQTVGGAPTQGKKHTWNLDFDSGLLHAGENEITITTRSGSWILYDAIALTTGADLHMTPVPATTSLLGVEVPPVWLKEQGQSVQPVTLTLRHIGPDAEAAVQLNNQPAAPLHLKNGVQTVSLKVPAKDGSQPATIRVTVGEKELGTTNLVLTPPPLREMWLLPHSHVDIGYTHRQADVINLQISNLDTALRLSAASSTNAPGSRFKWNPEAAWSLDHYLERATPPKRQALLDAVRRGDVEVDALYGNTLTGLCRPEELVQLFTPAARIASLTGVPLESAAICDVPGYTWGIVPIMAQAGVRYFAIGPNFGDRVGTIHVWDDQPFYWKSQSGSDRVLCWVVDNYHHTGNLEEQVLSQVAHLQAKGFSYDSAFIYWVGRWPDGGVDNAPPDDQLVEKALAWNAKYAAPKVTIGIAREFFHDFEGRQANRLHEFAGDLTPYWEDGAGSTARETAQNRASAERLGQAATLFAMRYPRRYLPAHFQKAWKNVLLYSEHTWGAYCSISKPDDAFTKDQWEVKAAFASDADHESRTLLRASLPPTQTATNIDVFNTTQWSRTDLAMVPKELGGEAVLDAAGQPLPSQRLASGELAFLAREVPAFGARRYRLIQTSSPIPRVEAAQVNGNTLQTSRLTLKLDPTSGAISSLQLAGSNHEFTDPTAPVGLNDFRYVLGTHAAEAQSNGPVQIRVLENGPVVASLRVESSAPGCERLVRDVRVVEGLDRVELVNQVDRKSVREKDAVHFGFGFNVPAGTVRMETPWAVVRPNADQLPGSCRNWFTVQRWVDISNPSEGITWAPIDAPLMEIGGLTANLLGSVSFGEWRTNAIESSTIYSWAQNNHWHTNYKIDQPGVTTFRYILRPHAGTFSAAESAQFGQETTRPLLVAPASQDTPLASLLTVTNPGVLVETIKPSEDGKALIVRLFGVSGQTESAVLAWGNLQPSQMALTDLTERPLRNLTNPIPVPAYTVVQIRAELP